MSIYKHSGQLDLWSIIKLTSSTIRVAMERPISLYDLYWLLGPSKTKRNLKKIRTVQFNCSTHFMSSRQRLQKSSNVYLVGTGTSVSPPSVVAWARRTNATKGFSRKSTSPINTLDASASLGIFFMNLFLNYWATCKWVCQQTI